MAMTVPGDCALVGSIPRDEELHQMGLLAICQALHMSATGASDPLPDELRDRYARWLRHRLMRWRDDPHTRTYDNAVKVLCVAALVDSDRVTPPPPTKETA